jgi:hypothetical protein
MLYSGDAAVSAESFDRTTLCRYAAIPADGVKGRRTVSTRSGVADLREAFENRAAGEIFD